MTRRTSRLSTLLRVRRLQEEISRGRLVAENEAERGTRRELEQAQSRYEAPIAEPPAEPRTTQGFVAQQFHRGALAGAVRAAMTRVDTAAQIAVLARHDWSEAARRMAALERLDDRAREAALHELLSAEQRTSEESGTAKLRRGPVAKARGKRR
jgi:flagellar protein FliJ